LKDIAARAPSRFAAIAPSAAPDSPPFTGVQLQLPPQPPASGAVGV